MHQVLKWTSLEAAVYFLSPCSVIRNKLASDGPFDMTDKFRIDIFIDKKLVGRKQVLSTLVKRKDSPSEVFVISARMCYNAREIFIAVNVSVMGIACCNV